MSTALLETSALTKHFGRVVALSEVTVRIAEGEVVGVVGPNGAGKTTLFDCILGVTKPDTGSVVFGGQRIDGLPSFRRSRLGIARTFQRLEIFAGMTPREHLLVTARVRRGTGRLWKDVLGMGRPTSGEQRQASELLDLVGLAEVADDPVETLSLGQCRLVELARAMVGPPRMLLLDEPSSGLDDTERARLEALLRRLRHQRQIATVLVEHDLELVTATVDRLVVLDVGRVIADGPPFDVMADPAVRRAYLGPTA